jgi:hypothetical protein
VEEGKSMGIAQNSKQKPINSKEDKRLPYQKPAIIYHGVVTTRAGSPTGVIGDPEKSGVDPSDLFGDGG